MPTTPLSASWSAAVYTAVYMALTLVAGAFFVHGGTIVDVHIGQMVLPARVGSTCAHMDASGDSCDTPETREVVAECAGDKEVRPKDSRGTLNDPTNGYRLIGGDSRLYI